MIAPKDVAAFIADVMENGSENRVTEIAGPDFYSPSDIARYFGKAMDRNVETVRIPREHWLPGLLQAGFTQHAAEFFMGMTQTVVDGKSDFTLPPVRTGTTFPAYLENVMVEQMDREH